MSQENVEIVREMFVLVNEQGVKAATDAFDELLDPDFELEEAANLPDQERFSGKDAFIANMAKLDESFEDLRIEPIEFVDLDSKLVVVVAIAGRGRAGGTPVETTIAQLWTLRNGKAVSLRDYASKAEAIEAAGLSSSSAGIRLWLGRVASRSALPGSRVTEGWRGVATSVRTVAVTGAHRGARHLPSYQEPLTYAPRSPSGGRGSRPP